MTDGADPTAPQSAPVRVSYIVLSHNSRRHIERCVRSLLAQGARDEVWVVENGSSDDSPEILRALAASDSRVRPIFLPQNQGTTASRNVALRRARGQYVAIVDSDVEAPPHMVDRLLSRLTTDTTCGIIAPQLLYPNGRLQLSADVFPTVWRKLRRYVGLRQLEDRWAADGVPTRAVPVDYAISAFWIMRRVVAEQVGFFDERIFYAPEDVDYCIRTWQQGFQVIYEPTVTAIHDAQEISRGFPVRRAALSHLMGLIYLFRKHSYGIFRSRPRGVPSTTERAL